LRDVGDVPAGDGRHVPLGRLYRSDAPISGDPAPDLRPWPPRTVVDLRSPGEAVAGDHPLGSPRTRVVNIPLFRGLEPGQAARGRDLPEVYRRLLRSSAPSLIAVLRVIAESPSPLLLHCAAGKDRTGVATAVTLSAVGVEPEAIIADYLRTEASLGNLVERLAQGWAEADRAERVHRITVARPDLMLAPVAAIEAVLETLVSWPGGVGGWLDDHGFTEDLRQRLRSRLTVEQREGDPRGS
jgi:hypothetical protein